MSYTPSDEEVRKTMLLRDLRHITERCRSLEVSGLTDKNVDLARLQPNTDAIRAEVKKLKSKVHRMFPGKSSETLRREARRNTE